MNVILLFGVILLFILGIIFSLFLLKTKYVREFSEDKLIDTDNEKYAIFDVEEIYKPYINTYKIFKDNEYRFLAIKFKNNVKFIDFNLVLYIDKKVYRILNVKEVGFDYKEEYVIKIPSNVSSVKLDIRQVNDETFEVKDIEYNILAKNIIVSILMSIITTLPLFLISLIVLYYSPNNSEYDSWNNLISSVFDSYIIYIIGIILMVLTFLLSFFILKELNKVKPLKFKEVNKEDNDLFEINKYLSFKVKRSKDKDNEYFKIVANKKRKFLKGLIKVTVIDNDDKEILSFEKEIDKYFKRIKIIKKENFKTLKVEVLNAYFKEFKYLYGTQIYNEYRIKQGVKGKLRLTNGVFQVLSVYLLVFIVSIGTLFYSSSYLYNYRYPYNAFDYEFISEEDHSQGIILTEYKGVNDRVYIPLKVGDYDVISISRNFFEEDSNVKEIYFSENVTIDAHAFSNAKNLEYADLSKLPYISGSAFRGTNLKDIVLGDNLSSIEGYAFAEINNINSITIENKNIKIYGNAFRNSTLKGDLILDGEYPNLITNCFDNLVFDACYISNNSLITKSNYAHYFTSNLVYFLSDCVHDDHSFIYDGSERITEKSADFVEEIPGTCIDIGYINYRCHYCNEIYKVNTKYDFNNHEYRNGYCTRCGRKEPTN